MVHLLKGAVNPSLGLQACVEEWPGISRDLREAPRRRALQIEKLEAEVELLS